MFAMARRRKDFRMAFANYVLNQSVSAPHALLQDCGAQGWIGALLSSARESCWIGQRWAIERLVAVRFLMQAQLIALCIMSSSNIDLQCACARVTDCLGIVGLDWVNGALPPVQAIHCKQGGVKRLPTLPMARVQYSKWWVVCVRRIPYREHHPLQ